jgi:hypothetical protein
MIRESKPMTPNPAASIAGSVLPIARAEELIATLQSVVSARISSGDSGAVDTVHVLVTGELTPKQVVRNVESALMAQLGMRVDHRKISVATTSQRPSPPEGISQASVARALEPDRDPVEGRQLYFEDVEVRGSRTKGSTCRVTLRHAETVWVGEAEGGGTRSRPEISARATLAAIRGFEGHKRMWELTGAQRIEAFGTSFMFVGVETWIGRDRVLLTGSCEIRESAETSAALAVLDATNRWLGQQLELDGRESERRRER